MKDLQLLIFDCDGVLVDSETLSCGVVAEMLSDNGLAMTAEEGVQAFAGTSMNYIRDFYFERMNRALPADFEAGYRQRSFEAFEKDLQAVRGVREAIEALDFSRCVASNGPAVKIKFNLQLTGLLPLFEGRLFSAYDIERWKPKPDLYLHAAKTMGFAPENCLVIEDSMAGVQAAKAANMPVLAYAEHSDGSALKAAGAEVFHSMQHLPDLVAQLQS